MLRIWQTRAASATSAIPTISRQLQPARPFRSRRTLLTLAIETSCDDTAVAVLETYDQPSAKQPEENSAAALLRFNEKITADNAAYHGIHPIVSLESHQRNVARLVQKAMSFLPHASDADPPHSIFTSANPHLEKEGKRRKPDFISVTRGPGMRSNLTTGLDTAKGLSVAWGVPLVGVHHMQAHALTPRLVSALEPGSAARSLNPEYPFLSLLASGGHTLLVHSLSPTSHRIIASTSDIPIGGALDKIARHILPADALAAAGTTMYGRLLEAFAFPSGAREHAYVPPKNRGEELRRRMTRWGWGFLPPMAEAHGGSKSRAAEFSFAGLKSAALRFLDFEADEGGTRTVERAPEEVPVEERRDMAREVMRIAFEHLASRVVYAMEDMDAGVAGRADFRPKSLVVSGGVAANQYLRTILHSFLAARLRNPPELHFPPLWLCTDNAAMIAWAGVEMFESGYVSELSIRALREWSLDSERGEGVLGVDGWISRGGSSSREMLFESMVGRGVA